MKPTPPARTPVHNPECARFRSRLGWVGGTLFAIQVCGSASAAEPTGPQLSLAMRLDDGPRRNPAVSRRPETPPLMLAQATQLRESPGTTSGDRPTAPSAPEAPSAPAAPEAPLPLEDVKAPTTPRRGAEPASDDNLPDLSASNWRPAPVRWGGNTVSLLNLFRDSEGGTTTNNTQTVTLRAASHVYQPWFAQINGNVGFLSNTTSRDGVTGGNSKSSGTGLTYGGSLQLFPVSRFPFQAYIDRSDSRASSNSLDTQFTSTRFGFRQSYRPEAGTDNYSFSYDRSSMDTDTSNSQTQALQGNYSASFDTHSVSAGTRFSESTLGLTGESSRLFNLNGSHHWRYDETLNVSSSAYFSNQQINYLSGGTLALNQNNVVQLASNFTWFPDEDLPMSVNGGATFLNMGTQTSTGSNQLSNLAAFGGMTYRFSPQLTASGNVQVNQITSNSLSQMLMAGSGALSYSGEPLTFGNYNYNWFTGASASLQSTSIGLNQQTAAGQFGHTVSRSLTLGENNILSLSASQSVSLSTNSQTGLFSTLAHSGGLSWRVDLGEKATAILSATLADNLTTGQTAGHFRTFSLTGNGLLQISRRSSLTFNSNLHWSQQQQSGGLQQLGAQVINPSTSNWSGAASVGYVRQRIFDVSNLNYAANALFNASQANQGIIGGDPNFAAWQTSTSLQQRLDYRVGRLNFQALMTVATVNGKKNASVFFQVFRTFGDY